MEALKLITPKFAANAASATTLRREAMHAVSPIIRALFQGLRRERACNHHLYMAMHVVDGLICQEAASQTSTTPNVAVESQAKITSLSMLRTRTDGFTGM